MLFNSAEFILLFLPIILLVYWNISPSLRKPWLVVSGYVFYSYWNYKFAFLMFVATCMSYSFGRLLVRKAINRRLFLTLSIVLHLSILFFFKYCNFFISSINSILTTNYSGWLLQTYDIILPLGISFYIFQGISYSIDIYRGIAPLARSFLDYCCYISLFPHSVAGPIVRFREIGEQLENLVAKIDYNYISMGIYFFVVGLSKKVIIADELARNVDVLISQPLGFFGAWTMMIGYTMQIYFDFSGYSDMAVGLAYLLGIKFPQNFNSPYKAINIQDFWQRWHMSLSFWLRDYLYISLGGNRKGTIRTYLNLFLTMLLGGLWHGASWTYVAWGGLHGIMLALNKYLEGISGFASKLVFNRFTTFIYVVIAWVLFRANDIEQAWTIYQGMFGHMGLDYRWMFSNQFLAFKTSVIIAVILACSGENSWEYEFKPTNRTAFILVTLFITCVLQLSKPSPFIYFQF